MGEARRGHAGAVAGSVVVMPLPRLLALIGLLTWAFPASADSAPQARFDTLLQESGLQLERPAGYVDAPITAKSPIPYEYALRHESGGLEIRYIVRPLQRIEIEYNDPHNAAPEPNHLFPLLFESITYQLSVGRQAPSNSLSEPEAQRSFNAQWAAISVFDVDPDHAAGYRNGVLVGVHRNDLADAYTLFLYNDYELAGPLINESLSALSFLPAELN